METRINHSSLVINFLDVGFDSNQLSIRAKTIADQILLNNYFSEKNDWLINFIASYNNGRQLLITRNKIGTYSKDKIKEITLAIPIPSIRTVTWGVEDNQYIYGPDHYDQILKNFWAEEVNFHQFSNRSDYVYSCLKKGIERAFFEGFTVGGIKVVVKEIFD
ncbi:hypothetical protein GO730_05845 [Spirosoma sp. HMF3257]|uniref:Uncharacterized protein n=1 Tax=Spirosoma telluris TaxID=2183553 RepID=A0A327NN16_9BACT|nr:hypothetical protein [Spirosoma telluris]RAI73998.1 hypothetical protein HMF3257_05800 [Spirosoma telluris]